MHDPIPTLEELWAADDRDALGTYDPSMIAELPAIARRYFEHSIEPGSPLYRAARLRMHGEIKLGRWRPFEAEQVTRFGRGLIWRAKARLAPLVTIKGHDAYVDGYGEMRWKLLGVIPVMSGDSPDIARSAAARVEIESLLLPTTLLDPSVRWAPDDDDEHAELTVRIPGDEGRLRVHIDAQGRVREFCMKRWGNPEGGQFHEVDFGGYFEGERRAAGLTIPAAIRCGWYFGSERYADQGEFFRATIDAVELR